MPNDDLKKDLIDALKKTKKSGDDAASNLKASASGGTDRLSKAASDRIARARAGKASASYTVAAGDSLSAIAQKHYGSADKWQAIYEANKDVIGDNPNAIKIGQELELPDLD